MAERYVLTEMSWPEVEKALKTVEIAIIPVGAHEQHGPNLAESCDAVRAREFSKLAAERLYPYVVVTPTVNMGISYHHMPFPGTITLRPETLIELLRDICNSLKKHGLKKFLFLNGHGGNSTTLDIATKILHEEENIEVAQVKYTDLAPESLAKYIHSEEFGHSCEREVSEALYLIPEIVKTDSIEKSKTKKFPIDNVSPVSGGPFTMGYSWDQKSINGALGDATQASKEIGKAICDEALDNLANFIEEFMAYKK